MKAKKLRSRDTTLVLLLIAAVCASGANLVAGEPPPVDLDRPAAVPTPPRPPMPLTEADFDPDVAKRPRLRMALGKARLGAPFCEFELPSGSGPLLPSEGIPAVAKQTLRRRWELVVAQPFLPFSEDDVEWKGRDEYPTAPEQNTLAARWMTSVGALTAKSMPAANGIVFCLRMSGDDRVSFRFLTNTEGPAAASRPEDVFPQDIVDKPRLREILSTCFRFPFETVDDFEVFSGPSGVYEGVPVFSGSIRWSRPLADESATLGWENRSDAFNRARLSITDSEPQYLCIGVATDGP